MHVVVPDGIDDPARPSGGNVYDRRICRGLAALRVGRARARRSPGSWPWPGRAPREPRWRGVVAGIPDGAVVLVDGLVASAVPGGAGARGRPAAAGRARAHAARRRRRPGTTSPTREPARARGAVAPPPRSSPRAAGPGDRLLDAVRAAARPRCTWPSRASTRPASPPGTAGGGELLCVAAVTRAQGARRAARGAGRGRGPAVALRLRRHARPRPGFVDAAAPRRPREAGHRRPGPLRRPARPAPTSTPPTPRRTCWCSPRAPRRTAWSSPRRWPAGCRSSRRRSAGCRRRSGRTRDGGRPGLLVPPGDAPRPARDALRTLARRDRRACAQSACAGRGAAGAPARPTARLGRDRTGRVARASSGRGRGGMTRRHRGACGGGRARWAARAILAVARLAAGHRPVPRRRCGRSTRGRWRSRPRIGVAHHGVRGLALEPGRPRPRRRASRCAPRSRRTTARSSSTPRCPAGCSATSPRPCATGARPATSGRGLRAVAWERTAGQVVQLVLGPGRALAASPVPACRPGCRSWCGRGPSASLGGGLLLRAGRRADLARCARPARRGRRPPRTGCSPGARGRASRSRPSSSSPGTWPSFLVAARTAGVDASPTAAAAAGPAGAAGDGGAGQRRRLGSARGRGGLGVRRRRARRRPGVATTAVYGVLALRSSRRCSGARRAGSAPRTRSAPADHANRARSLSKGATRLRPDSRRSRPGVARCG